MNVKSIPSSPGLGSVKESADEAKRQSSSQGQGKDGKTPTKSETKASTDAGLASAEATDAAVRASQTVDSQTLVELLAHPLTASSPAKFPSLKTPNDPIPTVKKLDRDA